MDITVLDNPGWHALSGPHRHLAIWGKIAARYQPGTFFAAGMPANDLPGFNDLRNLVEIDEVIAIVDSLPEDMPVWEIEESRPIPRMICEDMKPAPSVDALPLNPEDVSDMLNLIAITQPGPFSYRTIEMGQYFGLQQDDQLVAMAGERLHLTGVCEISAVCTHPEYRGRGYGSALTTKLAEIIIRRGEIPFLHVTPTNMVARNVYEKLGIRLRKEIQLNIVKRLA